MDQLRNIPVPPQTDSYMPIGHGELLDMVMAKLSENNITVTQQKNAVWRHGQRFFSVMQVTHTEISSPDMGLMLGVRNSLDKSLPVGLISGFSVFACSNGVFTGSEQNISRKHTTFLFSDLMDRIGMAVMALTGIWNTHLDRVNVYKNVGLSNMQAHDLIIQAFLDGVIDKTAIADVVSVYRSPHHQEHKGGTLWTLHNSFTEAFKGRADLIYDRSAGLHKLLDPVAGFNG
jgi:hypothetical protein